MLMPQPEIPGVPPWRLEVHEEARGCSDWKHIDERYLEGRRRHVLEEYSKLTDLNKSLRPEKCREKRGSVLDVFGVHLGLGLEN